MSRKREIHAYISEDLYLFIREYAVQYIELGYKNWLGRALEDAIRALQGAAQNTKSVHGKQSKKIAWESQVGSRHTKRIHRILSRLDGVKSTTLDTVIKAIIDEAGNDYRTLSKYLNILQGLYGMRFHEKNKCIVYFEPDPDVPTTRLKLEPKDVISLIEKCMQ